MLFLLIAIGILFIALIITLLFALQYFSLFDSIHVGTGSPPYPYGHCQIVYRIDYGHYNDSSPLFTEICSILPSTTTFGIYIHKSSFNDSIRKKISPERASTTDYVFMIGAILSETNQTIESSTRSLLELEGYRYAQLPSHVDNVVYCKFPYRGIISVVIASRRVYSAIDNYIQEHRLCAYPTIEIYDKDKIYFILPLSRQNELIELISDNFDGLLGNIEATVRETANETEIEEIIEGDNVGVDGNNEGNNSTDDDNERQNHHSDSMESNSSYEMVN